MSSLRADVSYFLCKGNMSLQTSADCQHTTLDSAYILQSLSRLTFLYLCSKIHVTQESRPRGKGSACLEIESLYSRAMIYVTEALATQARLPLGVYIQMKL